MLIYYFFLDLPSLLTILGTCSFINFWKKFHPAHLFRPARLLKFSFAWPRVRWKKANKFKGFHMQFLCGNTLYMIFCVKDCVVFCRSFCVEFCIVFCVNWKISILSYKLQIFNITLYFQNIKEWTFSFFERNCFPAHLSNFKKLSTLLIYSDPLIY